MPITQATPDDLDDLAPLFDAYRQFYGFPSDLPAARAFLEARLTRNESVVLLARDADHHATGFVQLYPTFASLTPGPSFILHDLFVVPAARRSGIATGLLRAAEAHARAAGAVTMTLSTAVTNHPAQRLYEHLGWIRDTTFLTYERPLT